MHFIFAFLAANYKKSVGLQDTIESNGMTNKGNDGDDGQQEQQHDVRDGLENYVRGKANFTFILDDPAGNTYLQVCSPSLFCP